MKGALGNPARGDAFYPRPIEIQKIYRILKGNTSIYLSAPRRVGKTSILKYLEDSENEDYYFIYVLTESVYSVNEFFQVMCNSILDSNAVSRLTKLSERTQRIIGNLFNRIQSIKGVDLREGKEPDYENLFYELLEHIRPEKGRVIIMIDEFPQTIVNIENKSGQDEARRFILLNRAIRHDNLCEEKISFIYTGSISLRPIVERLTSLTSINDIHSIRVSPWTTADARDLIIALARGYEIEVENNAIEHLLTRIVWYIPFHIQLICHEMVVIFDEINMPITEQHVDSAIDNAIDIKNKAQFDPYFSRLKGLLKHNEYLFALQILKHTAQNGFVDSAYIHDQSVKYEVEGYNIIIENLCEDGYLDKDKNIYTYTSPILQMWCLKHICDE